MGIPGLSQALDAAEWWQRNVTEGLVGNSLKTRAQRELLRSVLPAGKFLVPGEEGFDRLSPNATDLERWIKPADATPQEVMDFGYENSPWSRFAITAAADPLNLLGMGVPGKIAEGLPAASKLRTALEAANFVDQAPGKLASGAFDAAGTLAGSVVKPVAEHAQDAISAGLNANPRARSAIDAYNRAIQAWREQALFAVPYHLTNGLDNLIKPVARGDLDTAGQYIRGLVKGNNSGDELLARMKWADFPEGLIETEVNPSAYRSSRLGPPVPGTGVGPHGAQIPRQGVLRPLDAIGTGMEANRRLGQKIEGTARRAAFGTESQKQLAEKAKALADQLRAGGLNSQADELLARGGQINSDELSRALQKAGVPRADRIRLRADWEMAQREAQQKGLDYANKLYFDYGTHGPLDNIGRNLFAFHKFATHNLPYFAKESIGRPVNANVPTDYYRVSDAYNEDHGLPGRYHGEMPIGNVGGTDVFINPMKVWSFGQLVGAATRKDREQGQSELGDVAMTLKDLGLGLNPVIDAALMKTGQYGSSIPNGLLRLAQPINAIGSLATGHQVDIERAYKDLVSPPEAFPYTDYLRNKRLAELSVRDAQQVNARPYVQAMRGPDSPLAQQAEGDVARDQGIMGLVNSLLPLGFKTLNEEEAGIRQNAAIASNYYDRGLKTMASKNPTKGAYSEIPQNAENAGGQDQLLADIQNFDKLPPDRQQAILANPAARLLLSEHLSGRLHKKNTNPLTAALH